MALTSRTVEERVGALHLPSAIVQRDGISCVSKTSKTSKTLWPVHLACSFGLFFHGRTQMVPMIGVDAVTGRCGPRDEQYYQPPHAIPSMMHGKEVP